MTSHEELLEIHRVVMCIADASDATDSDQYTLREVKSMAARIRELSSENATLREALRQSAHEA